MLYIYQGTENILLMSIYIKRGVIVMCVSTQSTHNIGIIKVNTLNWD